MSDLDELDRLAAAATPGPWEAGQPIESRDRDNEMSVPVYVVEALEDGTTSPWGIPAETMTEADARYIAAADPTTIRSLIARLRAAESIVSTVYGGLDEHSDDAGKLRSIATWLDRIDNATDAVFESRGQEHRVGRQVQAELRRIADRLRAAEAVVEAARAITPAAPAERSGFARLRAALDALEGSDG